MEFAATFRYFVLIHQNLQRLLFGNMYLILQFIYTILSSLKIRKVLLIFHATRKRCDFYHPFVRCQSQTVPNLKEMFKSTVPSWPIYVSFLINNYHGYSTFKKVYRRKSLGYSSKVYYIRLCVV